MFPYGSDEQLTVMGKFKAKFRAGEKEITDTVYVTKEETEYPLVSEETAIALGLVSYKNKFVVRKVAGEKEGRNIEEEVTSKFPELFTGKIGKAVEKQVKIMVKEDIVPVAQKPQRISIHLTEKAEAKVYQLLKEDVIERFPDDEPRTWINPNVPKTKW